MADFDIESRIHELEDNVLDMKPTFVLYGAEGVGKSTYASYLPRAFLIDVDNGRASIKKTKNTPQVFVPNNIDELSEAFIYLKSNEEKYESVIIDTLTETENLILLDVLQKQCKIRPDKSDDLITQNDYGRGSVRMKKLIRKFRELDMITLFICHEREDKDDDTGVVRKAPAIMPSVMKELNAMSDCILNMAVDSDSNRMVLTQPTKRVRAKHRIGDLPKIIEIDGFEGCRIDKLLKMIEETAK